MDVIAILPRMFVAGAVVLGRGVGRLVVGGGAMGYRGLWWRVRLQSVAGLLVLGLACAGGAVRRGFNCCFPGGFYQYWWGFDLAGGSGLRDFPNVSQLPKIGKSKESHIPCLK